MKQDEKNLLSRQRIMESAMKEFGERGYGRSSINTICSEGGISKGILYHYFKDKDELYLACVQECFDSLSKTLREETSADGDAIGAILQSYFDVRISFFESRPLYQNIFCDAIVAPPKELAEDIARIKKEFDQLNIAILTALIERERLCDDITVEEVVEVFCLYQDFISARYHMEPSGGVKPQAYEQLCRKSINILLYGVIKRGEEKR